MGVNMSIISEHNLYGAMLDNYGARRYFAQPVYLRNMQGQFVPKGELTMPLHFCGSTAEYIYRMQDVALEKGSSAVAQEIKFFVSAAHVVFVPFGQAGYDYLKNVVAEKSDGKTVGGFLYEKFVERVECPLNGNLLKDLTDEQKEYVKEFFLSFENKDDIDCSKAKDVATLVCRLYFALDALLAERDNLREWVEKYVKPIQKEIVHSGDEVFRCRVSDLIGRIPVRKPLNEQEENYISELFGFAEKKEKN